jgi:DNA-binding winged helix-turn-helix (wHTH) protein/tetratricopeptide (TPR) repeat protein
MSIHAVGPFQLKAETLLLTHEGRPVPLGPKVVETLLALIEAPGEILSKAGLMERIWPEGFVEEANLAQNIHVLRRTFREYGAPDPIETSPRRGYRYLPATRPSITDARVSLWRRVPVALAGLCLIGIYVFVLTGNGLTQHVAKPGFANASTARLYQTARYYWNQRTREGVRKSLFYFTHVVDAEPLNALGYAGLADANMSMSEYCYGTHQPAVYSARAQEYVRNALALDPKSAEAHAALGLLEIHRGNLSLATAELHLATALEPAYGPAHQRLGIALVKAGRIRDGIAQLRIAAEIDPLSVATIAWLGTAAYKDHRFGDAVAYSQQALELSPERIDVLVTIGQAYEAQGDIDRAIGVFRQYSMDRYSRAEGAALLAHAYALAHRTVEARRELQFARTHAGDVDRSDLAAAAAVLGDGNAFTDSPRGHRRSPIFS